MIQIEKLYLERASNKLNIDNLLQKSQAEKSRELNERNSNIKLFKLILR